MKEQIIAMRRAGRSAAEITAFTGANLSTVKTICRRNNVVPITYINCLECGQTLVQEEKRKRRKFCCKKCKDQWWNKNRKWAVHGRD